MEIDEKALEAARAAYQEHVRNNLSGQGHPLRAAILAYESSRSQDVVIEDRIAAAKRRLGDLKAIHSNWVDGKDARDLRDIINDMEHIAFSVGCYLDGVPGIYLKRPADRKGGQ